MHTLNLVYVNSKWLSVGEALELSHHGWECKLIVHGIEKDLYEIYAIKGV